MQKITCSQNNPTDEFKCVLHNIDDYIKHGEILKHDISTTVAKVQLSKQNIVIKRFNPKGWRHTIMRSLRQSRAVKCWKNAHYLLSHKIATPQPLAVIEKKTWGFRSKSYYIMEYIDGQLLDIYLKNLNDQTAQIYYINKLIDIFIFFKQNHIHYRDPKTDNFLIAKNNVFLLDLDDMKKLSMPVYFLTRAWQKDRGKLIAYWNINPKIQALVRKQLWQKIK